MERALTVPEVGVSKPPMTRSSVDAAVTYASNVLVAVGVPDADRWLDGCVLPADPARGASGLRRRLFGGHRAAGR